MSVDLERLIRHGLAWSLASALTLRLGSLVLGIVLARLLTPGEFGVYAVALTVQTVLVTLADLALSAYLVHTTDPERRAPTVATLGLLAGMALTGAMALSARVVADLFGAQAAAPVIVVLSFTLLVSGIGVVPFGMLQRNFEQKKLFAASATDFAVGTAVAILLVVLGLGPMALAVARLVAQSCGTAVQFVLSKRRPQFGFDRVEARPALRFGIPIASANLLSWLLLNVDNMVIARVAGEAALGLYVLAFNVSSWPMTAIGQAVRSVALAAFSETARGQPRGIAAARDRGLAVGTAFTWAAAVPAGVLLAVLSVPLVRLLYGDRWIPSAAALAALGLFGALRVLFDMIATYLMARGAARPVLWIQALWIVALVPAMILGTRHYGIAGGGWAHVIIGAVVVLPMYLLAARRVGADIAAVVRALVPPVLAAGPAWLVAHLVSRQLDTPVVALLCGGTVGLAVYVGLLHRWLSRLRQSTRSRSTELMAEGAT
ncbi:oligosaccharide flippase family protein [Rhodococcus sp. NPDC127528]|uniref:oligosaccharide flippase family protein n=1 Tax=unclassified Rhodococcus (in: high G+C Gram-positive bacteria) TaxID=192944 RepID=UPI00363527B8